MEGLILTDSGPGSQKEGAALDPLNQFRLPYSLTLVGLSR